MTTPNTAEQSTAPTWLNNRKVQFAVGAALIFLFFRWLFTGDLFALYEASRPPAEGETKSVSLLAVIGPMLVEAVIIIGASAIAYSLRIWAFFVDLIDSFSQKVAENAGKSTQKQAIAPDFQPQNAANESADGLTRGLIRAVATNDTASKAKFETQIRRPYALGELTTALEEGDFEAADERMRELKELAGVKSPASSAKSAKGGA